MRSASAAETQLAAWLQRLVPLLLDHGGAVARLLVDTVAGRSALVELDDARVAVSAHATESGGLVVDIAPADAELPARLRSSGETLRALIDGRAALDAIIADGRLDVRAPLPVLLAFHALVLRALALGPRTPALQVLWAEFDAAWPAAGGRDGYLGAQVAPYGALRAAVPPSVQQARSPLFEGGPLP